MIQAITFDFWDTIAKDDSDEPRRQALGLPPKSQARLELLTNEILRHYPSVAPEAIADAFRQANAWFRQRWKEDYVTPTVAERLAQVYAHLGLPLTPGFATLVRDIEEMEVRIPPQMVAGAREAIAVLAERYKLAIISDAIHTPGRGIRQLLEQYGLRQYFHTFVFSDEVGRSKPDPLPFRKAAEGLGVPLEAIVHVGDRESNDVDGPHALGMKAVLFTGAVDRGSDASRAEAVCRSYADLPRIIAQLDGGA